MADAKLDVLPHLVYELWMLRSLCALPRDRMMPDVTNLGQTVDANALIESFVMHGRVLLEFLFYSPRDNYVRAADYLGGAKLPADKTAVLRDLKKRANTDAMHLTVGRVRVEKVTWDIESITRDISAAFEQFVARLGEPYLSELLHLLGRNGIKRDELTSSGAPTGGILGSPPSGMNDLRTHGPSVG